MRFDLVMGVLVAGFALWIALPTEKRLRRRGQSFARWNGAYIDSEFVATFDRASTWGFRLSAVLYIAVMGTGLALQSAVAPSASIGLVFPPVASVILAFWAFFRLRVAGREFPAPHGRPVVARPRRVSLSDYVAVTLQALVWLDASAVVTIAIVVAVDGGSTGNVLAMKVMTGIGAVALAGFLLLIQTTGRALCDRPQSAVDACHLYFQDAWRAEFLVGAYGFVACGTAVLLLGLAIPLDSPAWIGNLVFSDAFPFFPVFYGIQFFVFLGFRLQFRRRLWPTLAPGQVLLPGQPVPPKVGAGA